MGALPARAEVEIVARDARPRCVVEQIAYRHEGLRLLGWVMRPVGKGPWPAIVVNHGSRFSPSRTGQEQTQTPTLELKAPCLPDVASGHRLYFYPEGRGYGGSEGLRLADVIRQGRDMDSIYAGILTYLQAHARDSNAGVDALIAAGLIRGDAVVVAGVSHGGVVSLLSAAQGKMYRAVVLQATGLCYYSAACEAQALDDAMARIDVPVLLQHALNDTLVPPEVSRRLAQVGQRSNPDVRLIEYPGNPDLDGHNFFSNRNRALWEADDFALFQRAFAAVDARHASDPPPPPTRPAAPPLPANVAIVPPATDVPPGEQAFSGRWRGYWDGYIEHTLVVERVTTDGADIVYAFGAFSNIAAGWSRHHGVWDGGALSVVMPRPATVTYRLEPDGSIAATYRWSGGTSNARLVRQD